MLVAGKQGSRFYIEVWDGILDPKHYANMGEALWLYVWLLNRQTSRDKDPAEVNHGKPVLMDLPARDIGVCERTVRRWLGVLAANGYLLLTRTRRGYIIQICKAKKRLPKRQAGVIHSAASDRTKVSSHATPRPDRSVHRDRTRVSGLYKEAVGSTSSFTKLKDDTRASTEVLSTTPSPVDNPESATARTATASITDEIIQLTKDPKARTYYERIASLIPADRIRALIAVVRERSAAIDSPARYFAGLVRHYLEEHAADLPPPDLGGFFQDLVKAKDMNAVLNQGGAK